MDPLAHTLVGACLGEAGLKHRSRLAMPTLLLGANLPDVDAIATLFGRDCMYDFRRGWTHGVFGMLLGPWLLVGVIWLVDRALSKRGQQRQPASFWSLPGVGYLAVLSHPFLDWLNNYGVRLLVPLSDQWFYGDALFIVDPWLWLAMASTGVLAWSRSKVSIATWLVLGVTSTGLVLSAPVVPLAAKVMWCIMAIAIIVVRQSGRLMQTPVLVARLMLALLGTYIGLMLMLTNMARHDAKIFLAERGVHTDKIMAGPLPAHSLKRDVIAVTRDNYYFVEIDYLTSKPPFESHPRIARGETAQARAALAAPEVQGFAQWLRFPAFTSHRVANGYRVWIRDVRYSRSQTGIGTVRVDLDSELRPVAATLDADERQ